MDTDTRPLTKISFSDFTNIHQYATIAANSEGRVFYFSIPGSMIGFVDLVGNNWFNDTKGNLIIDGNIFQRDIQRVIGDIDQPLRMNPPIVVKNRIEYYVYNNDTVSHQFEMLLDGILILKKGD